MLTFTGIVSALMTSMTRGNSNMRELGDHPVAQWLVMGFALMAFFIAAKAGAAYLPDTSVFGAVKKVVLMA